MLLDREKPQIQEKLVKLFLRLNGFLSENFIIHAPLARGNILSEVDLISIRLPYHSEDEREVTLSPLLHLDSPRIKIIIGEVKTSVVNASFNSSLVTNDNAIVKLIKRVGIVNDSWIVDNIESLRNIFSNTPNNSFDTRTIDIPEMNASLSAILFLPECEERSTDYYSINGTDIFPFMHGCLNPEEERIDCAVQYNYEMWGDYEEIVRYFKSVPSHQEVGMSDLYDYIDRFRTEQQRKRTRAIEREQQRLLLEN
ncbi:TPA: hypothetical protein ACX6QT_000008 [Photobacterium damselae]